jgi:hypothetical protein
VPAARGESRERGAGLPFRVTSRWAVTVEDRSAVLILRVWVEDGMDSFRARLTTVDPDDDGGTEGQTFRVVSSPGDALDAVREWFAAFERRTADRMENN